MAPNRPPMFDEVTNTQAESEMVISRDDLLNVNTPGGIAFRAAPHSFTNSFTKKEDSQNLFCVRTMAEPASISDLQSTKLASILMTEPLASSSVSVNLWPAKPWSGEVDLTMITHSKPQNSEALPHKEDRSYQANSCYDSQVKNIFNCSLSTSTITGRNFYVTNEKEIFDKAALHLITAMMQLSTYLRHSDLFPSHGIDYLHLYFTKSFDAFNTKYSENVTPNDKETLFSNHPCSSTDETCCISDSDVCDGVDYNDFTYTTNGDGISDDDADDSPALYDDYDRTKSPDFLDGIADTFSNDDTDCAEGSTTRDISGTTFDGHFFKITSHESSSFNVDSEALAMGKESQQSCSDSDDNNGDSEASNSLPNSNSGAQSFNGNAGPDENDFTQGNGKEKESFNAKENDETRALTDHIHQDINESSTGEMNAEQRKEPGGNESSFPNRDLPAVNEPKEFDGDRDKIDRLSSKTPPEDLTDLSITMNLLGYGDIVNDPAVWTPMMSEEVEDSLPTSLISILPTWVLPCQAGIIHDSAGDHLATAYDASSQCSSKKGEWICHQQQLILTNYNTT